MVNDGPASTTARHSVTATADYSSTGNYMVDHPLTGTRQPTP